MIVRSGPSLALARGIRSPITARSYGALSLVVLTLLISVCVAVGSGFVSWPSPAWVLRFLFVGLLVLSFWSSGSSGLSVFRSSVFGFRLGLRPCLRFWIVSWGSGLRFVGLGLVVGRWGAQA